MAHDHNYSITFLKTPYGFLKKDGSFTQDINSNDILMIARNSYGKWAPRKARIKYFCEQANVSKEVMEELLKHEAEIETYEYFCECMGYSHQMWSTCEKEVRCDFWNGNREKLKFFKLY